MPVTIITPQVLSWTDMETVAIKSCSYTDSNEGYYTKYRKLFNFVDCFTALRLTVTSAPVAVRQICILLMNQHA
jgi:hypothetical protein